MGSRIALNGTFNVGLSGSSELIVKFAVNEASDWGLKAISAVQFFPASIDVDAVEQGLDPLLRSRLKLVVSDSVMLSTVSAAVPLFAISTSNGAGELSGVSGVTMPKS
jgi:hypothetical protein